MPSFGPSENPVLIPGYTVLTQAQPDGAGELRVTRDVGYGHGCGKRCGRGRGGALGNIFGWVVEAIRIRIRIRVSLYLNVSSIT